MKLLRLSAVLALAACTDANAPSSPPPVSLTTSTTWSGGQFGLRSQAFASLSTPPTVSIGGKLAIARRVDDSTLAVTAPIATGSFAVTVQLPTQLVSVGFVVLTGFESERTGPYMSGRAAWVNPESGDPVVFLNGDSGGVLLNLVSNSVVGTVPDSISSPDCYMSPGPTYKGPGYFTLLGQVSKGICGSAWSWQVYPSLVRTDSSPIDGTAEWSVMAEVGPQHWFYERNNLAFAFACDTVCTGQIWLDPSGPTDVFMNPADSRFTWAAQNYPGSGELTAVFNAAALDTAYTLPVVGSLLGAAFSPAGDTMFSFAIDTTKDAGGHFVADLLAIRASDGLVLRRVNVDSLGFGRIGSYNGSVRLDATRPWIYIAATLTQPDSSLAPALIVLDRTTWTVAGVALAKTASPQAQTFFSSGAVSVVPYPGGHGVYVVATAYVPAVHQTHGAILSFSTP